MLNAPEAATPCETAYAAIEAEQSGRRSCGAAQVDLQVGRAEARLPRGVPGADAGPSRSAWCRATGARTTRSAERAAPDPDTLSEAASVGDTRARTHWRAVATWSSASASSGAGREDEVEQRRHLEHRDDAEEEQLPRDERERAACADGSSAKARRARPTSVPHVSRCEATGPWSSGQGGDPVADHEAARVGEHDRHLVRARPAGEQLLDAGELRPRAGPGTARARASRRERGCRRRSPTGSGSPTRGSARASGDGCC